MIVLNVKEGVMMSKDKKEPCTDKALVVKIDDVEIQRLKDGRFLMCSDRIITFDKDGYPRVVMFIQQK
jgi:hypothetical protein